MGDVTEAGVPAAPSAEREARVAKLVADVDSLAVMLPKAFARCRLETVRLIANSVAEQSQAVRLSINLKRSPAELFETVGALRASVAQLRLLSSRTRIEQGTKLSILLIEELTAALYADLVALQGAS